jgi:CheY-like chemotaxis protein
MNGRSIMIADKDARYRSSMADYFTKAGYRVETTDSAEDALNGALGKRVALLLLGSDLGTGASLAGLIHQLKLCNSRLKIILVSGGLSVTQDRQVRSEGIFYHALKPVTPGDREELGQAVTCAFEGPGSSAVTQGPEPRPVPKVAVVAWKARQLSLAKLLPLLAGAAALTWGASYLSPATFRPLQGASSLMTWVFLSFCGLIFVGQLLPIFRIKLVRIWRRAAQLARSTNRGGD